MAIGKMQALVLDPRAKTARTQWRKIPTSQSGEVLIEVHAIALNPVDSLYVFSPLASTELVVGSDFAGVVVEYMPPVVSTVVAPQDPPVSGSRVAGFVQGACSANDRPGAFADYVVCPADLVWRVPNHMDLASAATVSLCALTAAQSIFYRLGIRTPFDWQNHRQDVPVEQRDVEDQGQPLRREQTRHFFIYGASTSVGLYAAQLVTYAATVSGQHMKLPYAYDAIVDYRDGDWAKQVQNFTGGTGVDYAYDCISEGTTVRDVSGTLADHGRMAVVRSREGGAWDPNGLKAGIEPVNGAVWEGLGKIIEYQNLTIPASPEARSFAVAFYKWLSTSKVLESNRVRCMPGGLENVVPDGFAILGGGAMVDRAMDRQESWMKLASAEKLVNPLFASTKDR